VSGSGGTIQIPSFIKIGSGFQNVLRCGDKHRHTGSKGHLKSIFFNKESRLIKMAVAMQQSREKRALLGNSR
jgi:hypothetical protein